MKKLAIVGSDPNSRHLAPFGDSSYDIWVFNEAVNHEWCKRWTTVFQMHDQNIYKGHNTKDPRHWDWLKRKHNRPIYMQEVDSLVPDSVRYPIEQALEVSGVEMFSTTFAYMAALVVLQGYEYVEIYGMGLSSSEYDYQKFGYSYWMGFLRGKLGSKNVVNTITHLGRDILESPRYGYEGKLSFGVDYFKERAVKNDNEWKSAERNLTNIMSVIYKSIDRSQSEKIPDLVLQYQAAALLAGEYAGALSEAERYQTFGNRYADRGGFENAAAQAQREHEAKRSMIWHYGGMVEYVWNAWKQTNNPAAKSQMITYIERMGSSAYEAGALAGMYKENLEYIRKYDVIADAGGRVLLEAK